MIIEFHSRENKYNKDTVNDNSPFRSTYRVIIMGRAISWEKINDSEFSTSEYFLNEWILF